MRRGSDLMARRSTMLRWWFLGVAGTELALTLPGFVWPGYLDSPVGFAFIIPLLSPYLLNRFGVPGLLENGGLCGWNWCGFTTAGWMAAIAVWSAMTFVVAWVLRGLLAGRRPTRGH